MYRVMIVEDDDIIAVTVKKHLEQWQYSVHIVSDLSNVIGEFTEYSPHIVLMDIKLPFYNGNGADGRDAAVFQWLSLVQ